MLLFTFSSNIDKFKVDLTLYSYFMLSPIPRQCVQCTFRSVIICQILCIGNIQAFFFHEASVSAVLFNVFAQSNSISNVNYQTYHQTRRRLFCSVSRPLSVFSCVMSFCITPIIIMNLKKKSNLGFYVFTSSLTVLYFDKFTICNGIHYQL